MEAPFVSLGRSLGSFPSQRADWASSRIDPIAEGFPDFCPVSSVALPSKRTQNISLSDSHSDVMLFKRALGPGARELPSALPGAAVRGRNT